MAKLKHYEKATKFEKISHLFWQNSYFYSVPSKQVGDFFKFLWPSQKSWTLRIETYWPSHNVLTLHLFVLCIEHKMFYEILSAWKYTWPTVVQSRKLLIRYLAKMMGINSIASTIRFFYLSRFQNLVRIWKYVFPIYLLT